MCNINIHYIYIHHTHSQTYKHTYTNKTEEKFILSKFSTNKALIRMPTKSFIYFFKLMGNMVLLVFTKISEFYYVK